MGQYVYLVLAIVLATFFVFLALKLIEFLDSLSKTIKNLENNLLACLNSINNTLNKLEPVISNLSRVEEDILATLMELRKTSNKLEPIFSDISTLANTYTKIGENINNTVNTHVKSILLEVDSLVKNGSGILKDVNSRMDNALSIIDEIQLLSKRFTVTTSVLLNSLQDLAIEVSSTTYGITKTIEYLRDKLFFKGGNKDVL